MGTAIAIGHSLSRLVVAFTATTYIFVQVSKMTIFFAEEFIRRQRQRRRMEINQEWEDWLHRKEDAEARQEHFDEPSPAEKERQATRI